MISKLTFRLLLVGGLIVQLTACSWIGGGTEDGPPDHYVSTARIMAIPDAVPRRETIVASSLRTYRIGYHWYKPMRSAKGYVERGLASWYGRKFHHHKTSIGEVYDMYAMTAAHKTLPLPSYVKVTNLDNGRTVVLRVNDRGPFHSNRIIDLSYAAAVKLGMIGKGTAAVEVRTIDLLTKPSYPKSSPRLRPATQPSVTRSKLRNYIQVGAFPKRTDAMRLARQLDRLGYAPVLFSRYVVKNTVWYRLRIGPLHSESSAMKLMDDLHARGFAQAILVRDR